MNKSEKMHEKEMRKAAKGNENEKGIEENASQLQMMVVMDKMYEVWTKDNAVVVVVDWVIANMTGTVQERVDTLVVAEAFSVAVHVHIHLNIRVHSVCVVVVL